MFRISPQSGIPIYRQLMEQIRRMIASGQIKTGEELPSVRSLAHEHAVNAMTISKAYSLLEAEGLLERQRGKAMTVATQSTATATKDERLRQLQTAVDQLVMSAQQLNLGREDVLKAIKEKMDANGD